MEAPRHVLLVLDDEGDLHSIGEESDAEDLGDARRATLDHRSDDDDDECVEECNDEDPPDDDDSSPHAPERRHSDRPTVAGRTDRAARPASSRFWGVSWNRQDQKWMAYYRDADGKQRNIGYYYDEEEAARAVNKATSDAGLQGQRKMNAVDASGALVPRLRLRRSGTLTGLPLEWANRSTVVAPDPAPTSRFWGVRWDKRERRWKASYSDVHGKKRTIGHFDTQEAAAHAYNAAIRAARLVGQRNTNPVVDGQLVPKPSRKRSRAEEPAAAP